MDEKYFDTDEYFKRVFENKNYKKKALDFAQDTRKFEIELFWQRGSYYWVFIAASFTAYFAMLSQFIKEDFLTNLLTLHFFEKLVLLILSSVTYLFSFAWVLVNKGSKFWQKNWESHIDILEDDVNGKMYKVILNTHYKKKFSKSPFSTKAFGYSVTSVTTCTSIILTIIAGLLVVFHVAVLFYTFFPFSLFKYWEILLSAFLLILLILATIWLFSCEGIKENKPGSNKKWYMREGE